MNLDLNNYYQGQLTLDYESTIKREVINLLPDVCHDDINGVSASYIPRERLYRVAKLIRQVQIPFLLPMQQIQSGEQYGLLSLFKLKDSDIYFVAGNCRLLSCFIFAKRGNLFKVLRRAKINIRDITEPLPVVENGIWERVKYHTIDFVRMFRSLTTHGCRPTRGIILSGPPGNGKTMMMNYLRSWATHKRVLTYTPSMEDVLKAPSILTASGFIFMDDFDVSVFTRRSSVSHHFLGAMDGMTRPKKYSVRIFSTNETIHSIDPAFKRPGRIDEIINVGNPSDELRTEFFTKFIPRETAEILGEATIQQLTVNSQGMSFSELTLLKDLIVQDALLNKVQPLDKYIESSRGFEQKRTIGLRA